MKLRAALLVVATLLIGACDRSSFDSSAPTKTAYRDAASLVGNWFNAQAQDGLSPVQLDLYPPGGAVLTRLNGNKVIGHFEVRLDSVVVIAASNEGIREISRQKLDEVNKSRQVVVSMEGRTYRFDQSEESRQLATNAARAHTEARAKADADKQQRDQELNAQNIETIKGIGNVKTVAISVVGAGAGFKDCADQVSNHLKAHVRLAEPEVADALITVEIKNVKKKHNSFGTYFKTKFVVGIKRRADGFLLSRYADDEEGANADKLCSDVGEEVADQFAKLRKGD